MITYIICGTDGAIVSINRGDEAPSVKELEMNTPEGGFSLDITGQGDFDAMDILDILNNYKGNPKTKKLVKRE